MTKHRRRSESPAARELERLIGRNLGFRLGPYLRQVARASVAAAIVGACAGPRALDAGGGDGGADASLETLDAGGRADAGPAPWDAGPAPWDAGGRGDGGAEPDAGPTPMADAGPPPLDAGTGPDGGPEPDAGPIPDELCTDEGRHAVVANLRPASPVDWVGAVEVFTDSAGREVTLVHESGTRCAAAADPAACAAAIDAAINAASGRAVVWERAGVVGTASTPEELLAFLGTIDTPNEAALVAWDAWYDFHCGPDDPSSVTRVSGGWHLVVYSDNECALPRYLRRHRVRVDDDGTRTELSSEVVRELPGGLCAGRRPDGLRPAEPSTAGDAVGAYLAEMARLEASSVDAFARLERELTELGAPEVLIAAAGAAREDEVRHAASMGALARRYGAEPLAARVDPIGARTPYAIARENAVEGCVRETYGALLGAHQALAATDPEIAAAMREVAEDELRHAELSWAVAAWLEPQLSGAERASVAEARREAIAELRAEAARAPRAPVAARLGLPRLEVARGMVDRLARELWPLAA